MDKDYEYNAPKYVDFEASLCENDASADAYFDKDHENPQAAPREEEDSPKKEEEVEKKKKTYGNIRKSWEQPVVTVAMLKEAAQMKQNVTPERKALRQAVAKTIESVVSNSPKLLLTKRLPRTGKGGALVLSNKAGSSSRRLSGSGNNFKEQQAPSMRPTLRIKKEALPAQKKGPLKATFKTAEASARGPPSQIPRGRPLDRPRGARNSSCGPMLSTRSRDRSKETATTKYVSTAEAIMNMQRCTPERFRSLPHNAPKVRSRSISPGSAAFHRTQPRSPRLMTKCRSRPTDLVSSEKEQMERDLEERKKHQFKARAVGEGLKPTKWAEVELRPGTIPQPFKLTESRTRKNTSSEEPGPEAFKANPVPKNLLDHPLGVPVKKTAPPVTPVSPNFATRGRVASREKLGRAESSESVLSTVSSSSETVVFKARPAPHFGVPTTLPPLPKKATLVQPFSFDERIAQADLKKKEKISEILEREKKEREFKAIPLPNFDKPINLPIKEHILPTRVEPFNLDIEKRVEARLKKWEENIEEESKKQKEAVKFKARPAELGVPFVPAPSNKPLVEISNFELHTDRRAIDREAFELQKKEKEVEIMEYKRLREDQEKLKEEEEIRRLRKEAVHKSNPIRKYPPIVIHPSDKPVTEAKSPNFVYKKNTSQQASD